MKLSDGITVFASVLIVSCAQEGRRYDAGYSMLLATSGTVQVDRIELFRESETRALRFSRPALFHDRDRLGTLAGAEWGGIRDALAGSMLPREAAPGTWLDTGVRVHLFAFRDSDDVGGAIVLDIRQSADGRHCVGVWPLPAEFRDLAPVGWNCEVLRVLSALVRREVGVERQREFGAEIQR
jgi:hypothetical protein